ncbi:MAG: FkbM family methyltransferase [Bacteroidia bacterium]
MSKLKKIIKKTLRINSDHKLSPLKNIVQVGSKFHGYYVPENFLNQSSICYCIGAGEDISFDTELVVRYGCRAIIFDPMPEGKNHYDKLVANTLSNKKMATNNDESGFEYRINSEQLKRTTFLNIGVWDKKEVIKFYKPAKEDYASHSVVNLQKTDDFIEAQVDRLSNIMKDLNHNCVDLVKMEIEGAEYKVIDTILEDKLNVKMILVEFDEVHFKKGLGYLMRIKKSSDKIIKAGYKMVHSTHMYKRTFVRNDVYEQLKKLENNIATTNKELVEV